MVIGVTGSISTGKTFVTDYLSKMGYQVIDADVLSRKVLNKGEEGYYKVIKHFSREILDDDENINRRKLAEIMFNNEDAKYILESIVHPQVINKMLEFISNIKKDEIVFLSIPLLFEINFEKYLDKTVVVYSNKEIQIKRLMERDKIDYEYALKKIDSQFSQDKKVELADYVIDNSFSKEETIKNINSLIEKIKEL